MSWIPRRSLRFRNPFRGGHIYRNARIAGIPFKFPPISSWEIGGNLKVPIGGRVSINMPTPNGVGEASGLQLFEASFHHSSALICVILLFSFCCKRKETNDFVNPATGLTQSL